MSYTAAVDQLNALVPELFIPQGKPRRRFSVEEIRTLVEALGNPQRQFPAVLIAGTNGKGSTAATLATILNEAGLRTGLYTSPHLERPNERIRVGREEISDPDFARLFFRVRAAGEGLRQSGSLPQLPSYFEILTAQAFLYFAEQKVDIAILEVGMGGRLDATNVVEPILSIVTDISLDHTEWLGPTITDIAREKAGILRRNGTLITLAQHPEADRVLSETAAALGSKVVSGAPYLPAKVERGAYSVPVFGARMHVDSPLRGEHQRRNIALAIAAAVELAERHGFPVTLEVIEKGIRHTVWPGRMERIQKYGMDWILDVAHNPAGALALRAAVEQSQKSREPRTLIFSCLRDKPAAEMAQILFPVFEQVIVAPIHSARATPIDDLIAAAQRAGTHAIVAQTDAEAIQIARQKRPGGEVVVSGSVYLVGEIRALLVSGVEA